MTAATVAPPLRRIARAASAAFVWRATGAGLMLVFQVVVARRGGAAVAGRFYLVFAVVSVLAVVGRYGTDLLALRLIAVGALGDGGRRVATLYRDSLALAAVPLAALSTVLFIAAGPLGRVVFHDPALVSAFRVGALAILPLGLVAVQGEALKGLGLSGTGAFVQSVVAPVVSLTVLDGVGDLKVSRIALVYVVGVACSAAIAHVIWRRSSEPFASDVRNRGAAIRALAGECRPFFWTSVYMLVLTWGGVIALGTVGSPADVASFFAADRWTGVCSMLLVAANGAVGPHFASLWAQGHRAEVRALLGSTTAGALALAAVVCGAIAVAAGPLLRVFGDTFVDARTALLILLVAQFVVLAGGPVTVLVAMTGYERMQQRAAAIAAATYIVLLAVLVPSHGVVGAAVAMAAALMLNKTLLFRTARRIVRD